MQTTAAAGGLALAGCIGGDGDDVPYEVWGLDQGTDTAYIYEADGGDDFDLVDEIDFAAHSDTVDDGVVPHMVTFTQDFEYAIVAATAGAQTIVVDAESHEIVEAIDTGAGSHFSGLTPDEEYIVVDVIGESEIVRVEADWEDETFDVSDTLDLADNDFLDDHEGTFSGAPICHSYDKSGRSIHTLGPSYNDGAVVVVEHDDFTIDTAWGHETLPANCGTMPHYEEDKFYLTAGLPTPTDDGEPTGDGVGEYYVLDTENDEILVDGESTEGVDAHGFWYTPDGEELWVLNRETNDGVIVDPDTDEVIEEIDAYGPEDGDSPEDSDAPDILWADPNGEFMFATLRGSNPVSGDPHAATGVNPGVSVLDVESREVETTLTPDADNDDSDFHAVGVRPQEEIDGVFLPPF